MNRDQYKQSLIKGGLSEEQAEEMTKGAFPEVDPALAAVDAAAEALEKGAKDFGPDSQPGGDDDDEDDDDEEDEDDDEDYVVPVKARKAMKGLIRDTMAELLEPLVATLDEQVTMAKGAQSEQGAAFAASLSAYTEAAKALTTAVRGLTERMGAIETNVDSLTKGLKLPHPPKGQPASGYFPHPSEGGAAPAASSMAKGSPAWVTAIHEAATRRGAVKTLQAIEERKSANNIIAAAKADGLNVD